MRKVFILYSNFFTPDGKKINIGGVETYIKLLCELIKKNNMVPIIFQFADIDFKNNYNGIEVYGVKVKKRWSLRKKSRVLLNACMRYYDTNNDIVVFGTHSIGVRKSGVRAIGIQHGITCDIKRHENYSHLMNLLYGFLKTLNSYRTVIKVRYFKILVCVDYNFLNWYRTKLAYIETPVKVIPNCTVVHNFIKNETNNVNIIFARRFYEYRGTKLFASVIKKIIMKYKSVNVTFAGSGPDEGYLREMFKENPNVNFIEYNSEHSIEVHKNYQIAVVPSIGSEGTSLALIEAMAAKCAVIATNVGGMSNVILDHYNGLLVNPNESELYNALEKLIIDKDLRERLSNNGFLTVSEAFNRTLWEERWTSVFEEVISDIKINIRKNLI